jgi:outer membrane receptor for ferric coprogen and ferric-rhodotorulic acid
MTLSTRFARAAFFGASLCAISVSMSVSALAQDAAEDDSFNAEIIVTAQKRSESIQDVPVAVSVVSGDALERQGGVNIENAQYLVPSLNFRKSGTALNQSLYLRGVGTTTFSIGGEPSVGTVLDGVVLARSGEAFSDLVDIERIEVLRGPQGTLYGRNARCSAKMRVLVSSTLSAAVPVIPSADRLRVVSSSAMARNIAFALGWTCRFPKKSARASPAFIRNGMATSSTKRWIAA